MVVGRHEIDGGKDGLDVAALGDLPQRPPHHNATGNLFPLLKSQGCHSSAARRRRDPSMQYNDPLNAGLVPPFQRPQDSRSTLTTAPTDRPSAAQ